MTTLNPVHTDSANLGYIQNVFTQMISLQLTYIVLYVLTVNFQQDSIQGATSNHVTVLIALEESKQAASSKRSNGITENSLCSNADAAPNVFFRESGGGGGMWVERLLQIKRLSTAFFQDVVPGLNDQDFRGNCRILWNISLLS